MKDTVLTATPGHLCVHRAVNYATKEIAEHRWDTLLKSEKKFHGCFAAFQKQWSYFAFASRKCGYVRAHVCVRA